MSEEQKCPACGSADVPVIEVRWPRRRRECKVCKHRITTYEVPAERLAHLEAIENHAAAIAEVIAEADKG